MKIECILLEFHKCNQCDLRKKCWKVWKFAAFNLSLDYKTSLEHIAELKNENQILKNRLNERKELKSA